MKGQTCHMSGNYIGFCLRAAVATLATHGDEKEIIGVLHWDCLATILRNFHMNTSHSKARTIIVGKSQAMKPKQRLPKSPEP